MTRKELYKLSVELSSGVLREFFEVPTNSFSNMESTPARKAARKLVYDTLAPLLLPSEPSDVNKPPNGGQ